MKKRKLKGYVLPSIYIGVCAIIFTITFLVNQNLQQEVPEDDNYQYVVSPIQDNDDDTTPVVNEQINKAIKPYLSEGVTIAKDYYEQTDDEEKQKNSLIYYEKTYMQNTGVLYESEEQFDVIAVLDGIVKEVKTDELLGNVVIIEHDSKISTVYYSLGELTVKAGDIINQGDTIAISGANKLNDSKANSLLFEVYIEGKLTNPNKFFEMNLDELN